MGLRWFVVTIEKRMVSRVTCAVRAETKADAEAEAEDKIILADFDWSFDDIQHSTDSYGVSAPVAAEHLTLDQVIRRGTSD